YVPGPEYPPSPEFVPEPVYPEFMPAEDDILPAEEQPLPAATSPTIKVPGYIDESDPEDDPEEDPEDDPEEDPADYPADGGEEGDDEDESSDDEEDESSDDDEDDDIDIEGDEEEYEYLAPADSTTVALPAIDHAPSAEETEPFKTDESGATPPSHPAYRVTARMDEREEIHEADLPLRKRLCTAHTSTYELGESSAAAATRLREPVRDDLYRFVDTVERGEGSSPATVEIGYGITDTWDDLVKENQEKDKIGSKPDKTGKRGEAEKSQKQLQLKEEENPKKTKKEWPKTHAQIKTTCNYHHDGPCAPKCQNCNKIGHYTSDCRNVANANNANNQRGTELGQKPTCYECGVKGHYKRECPKLKNNNKQGNQGGRNNAPARVYAVGRVGADPGANVVT
nr:hypothetical protein [Tanacetum cinerariifolium]